MKYNKDYSKKTADEWFAERKWTGFLMQIPLNRLVVKDCGSIRDLLSLRSTAGMMSSAPAEDCDRCFSFKFVDGSSATMFGVEATKK